MSEAAAAAPAPAQAASAGRLLREARERQGLHIAALAASIKVAPKKLEMLEADRYDALPDATFTRALAQTVCRALKIDASPVLSRLPPPVGHRLEHVAEGLNAPFRDRPGALVQRDWPAFATRPIVWVTALILAAALAVVLLPSGLLRLPVPPAPTAVTEVVPAQGNTASRETPGMPPGTPVEAGTPTAPSDAPAPAPAVAEATSAAPAAAADPVGVLQVRTSAASWVEVTDASGQPLISRLMQPGEAVALDGAPPLRVRIGNAAATQLTFRGQPTALAAFTRDNVARLELR